MLIIWRSFLFILADGTKTSIQNRYRTPNENLIRYHNFHVYFYIIFTLVKGDEIFECLYTHNIEQYLLVI